MCMDFFACNVHKKFRFPTNEFIVKQTGFLQTFVLWICGLFLYPITLFPCRLHYMHA